MHVGVFLCWVSPALVGYRLPHARGGVILVIRLIHEFVLFMGINNITGSNFKHAKSNCFSSSLLKLIIRFGFSATSYFYE